MKKEKTILNTPEITSEAPVVAPVAVSKVENKVTKVGSLLKEMRLQKGLKISDISKKLCIRKVYLEAIEESDYVEIPAFPYGVGFVRSYANYLGLNGGNIVELYKEEVMPKTDKQMFVLEPQSEASVPNKKYLFVSLAAIVLLYAGWSIFNNQSEEATPSVTEEISVAPAQEELPIVIEDFSAEPVASTPDGESAPAETAQVVVTDAAFVETPAAVPKVEPSAPAVADAPKASGVVVKVKAETWVEVKDGSKLYLSKVLKPGATYTIPEGEGMVLSVGKYDGVEVLVNGVVTPVVKSTKKMNIALDEYIKAARNH